jgi:hypothetical protein
MKKCLNFLLVLQVFCLSLPSPSLASKPWTTTLEGCVMKGVFYSVDEQNTAKGVPRTNAYRIDAVKYDDIKLPYDLSPYEGKKIRVQGRLHPGDTFQLDSKTLKVLGPCDQKSRDAIRESLTQ